MSDREELCEAVLHFLNEDIDDHATQLQRWLNVPYEARNNSLWHGRLLFLTEKLTNLRIQRAELLVERGREQ